MIAGIFGDITRKPAHGVLTDRIQQLHCLREMLIRAKINAEEMTYYIGNTSQNERQLADTKRIILSTYSMAKRVWISLVWIV